MSKRILYLSDYELRAFQTKGNTLVEVQRFQMLENGETEFAQYLSSDSKTPIHWLVDTTQEEYQTALLPHVVGKDHRDLMSHKKKRLFKKTSCTYGVVQGREKQGRGDDRVLFTALNNPALLQPWLDLIIAHKVPLAGIYSLPLLSEYLLKYLPKAAEMLLVTHTPPISSGSPAGLRQSFFVNQKLQFSRLIPLTTLDSEPEYVEYVLKQIVTTKHFLDNTLKLSQTEPNAPLLVVIATNTPFFSVLNKHLNDAPSNLNIHVLDNIELVQKIGLQFEGGHFDQKGKSVLYLHNFVAFQLSRRWYTRNHYASKADTRYLLYRKARLALYLTAVLLVSSAGWVSSMIFEEAQVSQQKGQEWLNKTLQRQAELAQLQKQGPSELPPDIIKVISKNSVLGSQNADQPACQNFHDRCIVFIRNVVDVGRHLKAHHLSPRSAWEKLSHVLNRHPDVLIERLEWGIGHSTAEIFQPYAKSGQTTNEEPAENANNLLDELEPGKHFLEGMRLHGKIYPFKGNYENALHIFEQFVKELREQRQQRTHWVVEILLAPYDPNKTLMGKIGSPTEEANEAPFVINILIEHAYLYEPS